MKRRYLAAIVAVTCLTSSADATTILQLDLSGRRNAGLGGGESDGDFASPKTFDSVSDLSLNDVAWSDGAFRGVVDISLDATVSDAAGGDTIGRGGKGAFGINDSAAQTTADRALLGVGEGTITLSNIQFTYVSGDTLTNIVSSQFAGVYIGNWASGETGTLNTDLMTTGNSGGDLGSGQNTLTTYADAVVVDSTGGSFSINGVDIAVTVMSGPGTNKWSTITWGASTAVSTASDVDTSGTLIEAFNAGKDGVSDQTVNGVLFIGTGSLLPSTTAIDAFSGDTGDAAYNALLRAIDYGGGGDPFTNSVGNGNLEVGAEYLLQVWYVDSRFVGRTMRFGDGSGHTVDVKSDDTSGGEYVVGTFIAADTSQVLTYDAVNMGQAHITAYQIRTYDSSSVPVPALTTATHLVSGGFIVNVDFTEDVTGLEESDIAVANGSVTTSSLSGTNAAYAVEITPVTNGYVAVSLPASSVTDIDGDSNQNPASDVLSVLYIAPGSDQPSVTLSTASSNVIGTFMVDVNFDEAVTGLELTDFLVGNGGISNLAGVGASYTVQIIPTAAGVVTVSLPENVVTDLDGDNLWNPASDPLIATYQIPDTPSVALYGNLATDTPEYDLHLSFSEEVTGLESSDFDVVNGAVTSIEPQGRTYSVTGYYYSADARYYRATVTAASTGTVEVTLPAGVVTDIDGDSLGNTVSSTLSFRCRSDFGEQWIVGEEVEWTAATLGSTNLTISGGYATPVANTSQFTSIIRSFPTKKQARTLTFQQSPVWGNWTNVGEIDPTGATDAPVMVSIEDGNYFYLANISGVYNAWHSTNMVDWVLKGPVTSGVEGRWVTSAEYKDGVCYIYSDYANDHTSHLFTDTNLADGVAGTYLGVAFHRPIEGINGHGSDNSLIRSDEDGLFHLLYEDWSPISARTHSWDSPLAGHTSSEDGLTGFELDEHQSAVDLRTMPTGIIGTYNHPFITPSTCRYEIHEPEQDAYGDWTSIKIGSRFYLFGDYDHHDGSPMSVAMFTSDSVYGKYERVNDIKSGGHPDPTVCFAEGQFYLLTQRNSDFTSPGPWVDGVEARAGVDTNANGTIDQWTMWQSVSEHYDHTPGYIRVVTLTPAQLDLSGLPAGYGFQFEFRVDDTFVKDVTPIMDSVVLDFEPSNFQQWANTNGIPADVGGDNNTNGMPDVIEFSIGQTVIPERQADGKLTVTAVNEAIDDGLRVELWFVDNLLESWTAASTETVGVTLLSDVVNGEGNHELVFEVFDINDTHVFWTLVVALPE